jgi:hypothetical protein
MSSKTGKLERVQILRCEGSESHGHCWHFKGHDHASFDKCCFCGKAGEAIFGAGYNKEKSKEGMEKAKK